MSEDFENVSDLTKYVSFLLANFDSKSNYESVIQ